MIALDSAATAGASGVRDTRLSIASSGGST